MIDFNKQFFKKHQKALLFVANKWWLKWLLGLNRLPKDLKNKKIAKIDVASISWEVGQTKKRTKYKGVFFTRPRFAEALAYNLSPFYYLKNYQTNKFQWRFSPAGLAFGLLFGYFGGIGFMGTTTNYYAGAGDGRVKKSEDGAQPSQTTWNTAHDAAIGTFVDYTSASEDGALLSLLGVDNKTRIARAFLPVNTSGLPDDATISAAILKLYLTSIYDDYNGSGYDYIALVQTDQPNSAELTTADYNNCGATDNPTKGSADIDISGLTTGSYQNLTLNATGRGWIQKTGTTMIGVRVGQDIQDIFEGDPGENDKNSGIRNIYSEQTGTDQDPYLEVTYSVAVDHTVTCSDAVAFSTTIIKEPSIIKTETMSMSESEVKSSDKAISEALSLFESVSLTTIFKKAFSVTLTLNASKTIDSYKKITDSLNLVEQQILDSTITKTEAVSLIENLISSSALYKIEVLALVESISKFDVEIEKTEVLGLDEMKSTESTYEKRFILSLALAEQLSNQTSLTQSEVFILVESLALVKEREQILIDTLALVETLFNDISISKTEVLELVDVFSRYSEYAKSLSESLNLTEILSKDTTQLFTETLSFAEFIKLAVELSKNDIVNITETIILSPEKRIATSFLLTEHLNRSSDISLLETFDIVETLFKENTLTKSDILFLVEAYSILTDKKVSDSVDITDSGLSKDNSLINTESLSLADILMKASEMKLDDTLSIIDTFKKLAGLSQTDTLNISENLLKEIGVIKTDDFNITELLTKSATRMITDSVVLTEDIFVSSTYSKNILDLFTLQEAIKSAVELKQTDVIVITEVISKQPSKPFSDEFSIADDFTKTVNVVIIDSIDLIETLVRESEYNISKTDIFALIESMKIHEIEHLGRKTYLMTNANKTYLMTNANKTYLFSN